MFEKNPESIEEKSFKIIGKELEADGVFLDEKEDSIIKRVIHTTADFEYAKLLKFHDKAIENGLNAIKRGEKIYCDTRMIQYGLVSKRIGCELVNYVHDEDVYKMAKEKGITRSMAAIEKAVDEDIKIFAIGNAPTALYKIKEYIESGKLNPDLIIAVPVGFVGAAESKEEIMNMDVPYIATKGRKGGSPIAVAIINALFKKLK